MSRAFEGLQCLLMTSRRHLARASLAILLLTSTFSAAHAAKAVEQLAGRWSGWGTVNMTNGTKEQVKCVATFFIENNATSIRQNLRCASAAYKIDVRSNLNMNGKAISGTWEERNHNNAGTVSGRLAGSTFRLAISGSVLNAQMTLNAGRCKMNMNITPVDFNVQRIAIGLRKC